MMSPAYFWFGLSAEKFRSNKLGAMLNLCLLSVVALCLRVLTTNSRSDVLNAPHGPSHGLKANHCRTVACAVIHLFSGDMPRQDQGMGGLKLFLDDGTVEMDSNNVERPIALNRNNALFAGHDEGGRTWARIASLIETCKLNGVEPYAYLKPSPKAIQPRIDELMQWNFDKQA
jgi:hypothetical protein